MNFVALIEKSRPIILASLFCGAAIGAVDQPAEQTEPVTEEPASVDMVIDKEGPIKDVYHGEIVNRVFAPHIHDWVVLDQQRLILYVTRSRPYLVTLRRKARLLGKSSIIGLERHGNSIDSRFDQIFVDGIPFPLKRIEKVSVETARRLRGLEVIPEKKD